MNMADVPVVADALSVAGTLAPLLPFAALELVRARRPVDPHGALVVYAFLISLVADGAQWALAAAGQPNQWLSYLWAPAQYAVLLGLLIRRPPVRHLVWAVLALVALTLIVKGPLLRSETVVQVVGGVAVARLIAVAPAPLRALRGPVTWYTLGQAPLVLLMAWPALAPTAAGWGAAWAAQMLVRITALVWLAWRIARAAVAVERRVTPSVPLLRLEVSDGGPGSDPVARPRRRLSDFGGTVGGGHPARVAGAG